MGSLCVQQDRGSAGSLLRKWHTVISQLSLQDREGSDSAKPLGHREMGPSGKSCSGWEGNTEFLPVLAESTTCWDTPALGSAAPSKHLALAKQGCQAE